MDEQDLLPGQFWHDEVSKAIQRSNATVILVSANASPEKGFWSKELELVLRKSSEQDGRAIIPVRLDKSEPPASLRHLQWIDYFGPDGPDRLVQAIEQVLRT